MDNTKTSGLFSIGIVGLILYKPEVYLFGKKDDIFLIFKWLLPYFVV